MKSKFCILEQKLCTVCGECDLCDLNPMKKCDNCCTCIEDKRKFAEIKITKIIWEDK